MDQVSKETTQYKRINVPLVRTTYPYLESVYMRHNPWYTVNQAMQARWDYEARQDEEVFRRNDVSIEEED